MTPKRWDAAAIRAGATVSLVLAVPFSVAARLLAGSDAAVLLVLLAAVGFFLGGGVAAWHQTCGTPLSHALVTSAGAYVVPQAVFVLVKVLRGGDVNWSGVILNLIVVVSVGALGGIFGSTMRSRGVLPQGRRGAR